MVSQASVDAWISLVFHLFKGEALWQLHHDLHLSQLSNAWVTWFREEAGGKFFLKEKERLSPASPASCISPPQGCQRPQGRWWGDRAGANTSYRHQMEILRLSVPWLTPPVCRYPVWCQLQGRNVPLPSCTEGTCSLALDGLSKAHCLLQTSSDN